MRLIVLVFSFFALSFLNGCAHYIDVSPNPDRIEAAFKGQPKIKKNVVYFIPGESKNVAVNSRGGGGDSVNYYPYRDFENGFVAMLSVVFEHVDQLNDLHGLRNEKDMLYDYMITPELLTDSYSISSFTWPPTNFTINLICKVMDTKYKQVSIIKVIGEGSAEYSEFLYDKGLAGKRAMEDALLKMKRSLSGADYAETKINTRIEAPIISNGSITERLKRLKDLDGSGLITNEEFQKKKKELLDEI